MTAESAELFRELSCRRKNLQFPLENVKRFCEMGNCAKDSEKDCGTR